MSARFNLEEVDAALAGTPFAGHLHHVESTPSTNTLALKAAQRGVATGVWVADEQTAGRGRGGHRWHSAAGDGLYVSVLLRPQVSGVDVFKLSLAAGMATVDAVAIATGITLEIRWPNDIMSPNDGKKVGGVLTEVAMDAGTGLVRHAVVGIGLNLNQSEMPEELANIASSLWMTGAIHETRREFLLPFLLDELTRQVAMLSGESDRIEARFAAYSPMIHAARVHVAEDDGYTGVTDGLDPHGRLRVQVEGGATRLVRHGGVRPVTA